MIRRTITIDGKDVPFAASASVPRIYRTLYGRDVFKDMKRLFDDMNSKEDEVSVPSLEIFENLAHCMAYHADPQNVPPDPAEWLDQFGTFSIYQVLPQLIELWGTNTRRDVDSKKKLNELAAK